MHYYPLCLPLTAILAKIGIKNVDSIWQQRSGLWLFWVAWGIVWYQGTIKQLGGISKFSVFWCSGITTGLSWLFYFRALQWGKPSGAPIDKLSLVITIILAAVFERKVTFTTFLGVSHGGGRHTRRFEVVVIMR